MKKYKSWKSRLFDAVVVLLLIILGLSCLVPLLHVLALSLSSKNAAISGKVYLWPEELTFTPYKMLITDNRYLRALAVSFERVFLGGSINLVMTVITAFVMSQEEKDFPARKYYMWILLFAMLFGANMVPWYFMIKATGLMNTIWALVIPGALPIYNAVLVMNFFRNLPKEIKESALLDGVNPVQMLVRIYLPLSLPALATVTVFSVVGHWNDFFNGMLLINSPQKVPLQTYIQSLTINTMETSNTSLTPEELAALSSLKTFNAAKIIVAALPIVIFYPFMQKFFVSGLTLGSVKE
ncbi:carbohydrate ABC transporter permease [uncultured Acetatifactor sp.]|jgi:putative aldouronate transport system permease protein|uniref:carbohydrate ABC transporter permease n=1 Tax=uncultured Acetatifactor sp. TaxID=1671927 RepID=UPI002620A573|nr:carbohydrate ABC transporter permease [uncultured Acetatifactor sp.]